MLDLNLLHEQDVVTKYNGIVGSLEYLLSITPNNSLVTDLNAFYDKLIKEVKSFTEDATKITLGKYYKSFRRKRFDYYREEFRKLTKKNLGTTIDFNLDPEEVTAHFSLNFSFSNWLKYQTIEELISFGKESNKVSDTVKKMLQDGMKFDFNLNKFLETPYIENLKPRVTIGIPLVDLDSVYNDDKLKMQPEELTAITLHEIGHLLFVATGGILGGYTGINISMLNVNLLNNFKKCKNNINALKAFTKELKSDALALTDMMEKHLKNEKDSKIKELGTNIISFVKDICSWMDHKLTTTEKIGLFILYFIMYTLIHMLLYLTIMIILFFFLWWFPPLYATLGIVLELYFVYLTIKNSIEKIEEIDFKDNNTEKNLKGSAESLYDKLSRQLTTEQQYYANERFADEVVAKFGYSEYLATALSKFYGVPTAKSNSNWIKMKRTEKALLTNTGFTVNYFQQLLTPSFVKNIISKDIYENIYDRLYRMLQNNRALLKSEHLSKEYKSYIISQNEVINSQIKLMKRYYPFLEKKEGLFAKLWSFLVNASPGSFETNSPELEKYTKLYNQFDEMMNNILFETSFKLQHLARK